MRRKANPKSGFSLVELFLVVSIVSILSSILIPRAGLLLQKASQSATKSNLGSLRSAIALYYTETEGLYPFSNSPDGFLASGSMTELLVPRYIGNMPLPKLLDYAGNVNDTGLTYDSTAREMMMASPPVDIFLEANMAPRSTTLGVFSPFGYDQANGVLFIYNDNYDTNTVPFHDW